MQFLHGLLKCGIFSGLLHFAQEGPIHRATGGPHLHLLNPGIFHGGKVLHNYLLAGIHFILALSSVFL
jgi:hypothetical protein